jgi:hypothetical protein
MSIRGGIGQIGGITIDDDNRLNPISSFTHLDNTTIPAGKAFVYPTSWWYNQIKFEEHIGKQVMFDTAGIAIQKPAYGVIESWDGATLVVAILNGDFKSRNDFGKITHSY